MVKDQAETPLTAQESSIFTLEDDTNLVYVVPTKAQDSGAYSVLVRATTDIGTVTYLTVQLTLIDHCASETVQVVGSSTLSKTFTLMEQYSSSDLKVDLTQYLKSDTEGKKCVPLVMTLLQDKAKTPLSEDHESLFKLEE